MVYVLLAEGFEEVEALTPVDLLRRAGVETRLVGVTGATVCGARGINVVTDLSMDEVDLAKADMLVLPGGMPLRQDEISTTLNVSHIPVREALRQLEAQGLVRIYPNRGAVVTKLCASELANVMDTRIMLETGTLGAAIPLMTDETICKARQYLDEFNEEQNMEYIDSINLKLHFALYEPSGNKVAIGLIDQFHANVDRYLHPFYTKADMPRVKNIAEHRALIDACEAKDIVLAKAILRTHLESTKRALLKSPLLAKE